MSIIIGTVFADTLQGGPGADSISGGDGNDQISGGGGADTLSGGNGSDTFTIKVGESLTSSVVFGDPSSLVHITDFTGNTGDRLVFEGEVSATTANFIGIVPSDFNSALSQANNLFATRAGTVYIVANIGPDAVIFNDHHQAVVLSNASFFTSVPFVSVLGAAAPPPPPVGAGSGVTATIGGNIDTLQLQHLIGTNIVTATPTLLMLNGAGVSLTLGGSSFTYDVNAQLNGGTVSGIDFTDPEAASPLGRVTGHITGLSLPAQTLVADLATNATAQALNTIFAGSDGISGTSGSDLLRGYDGNDTIQSVNGASDTIFGGNGDDSIIASATSADVINGGLGEDTLAGGGGSFKDVFAFDAGESPMTKATGGFVNHLDHITDWTGSDFLQLAGGPIATPNNYAEITAFGYDQAASVAQSNAASGIEYTVAQLGSDVVVFDTRLGDAVVLTNRSLTDISLANVGGNPALAGQPPSPGATVDLFDGADMGAFQESQLNDAIVTRSSTLEHLTFGAGTAQMFITGSGFAYDSITGAFIGGTVTGLEITSPNGHFVLTGSHTDATILAQAHQTGNADLSTANLLSGDDVITVRGSVAGADTSFTGMGFGGNDLMIGGGSLSTFSGGDGNDTLQAATATQSYLRGDAGDDSISGGAGFDDANGNMGNDTIHGNAGDDFSVGGKDNDLLFGDDGNDIVWGNLGNDTCDGGNGADQCRGGQGDDSVTGGAGDDFISGDRGNDTVAGGAGADIFHTSQDAGIDRVLDFHLSEGDRVQLDPGTTFSLIQVGADTVIDMGSGNQMILVGVQMTTLTPGWIFGA